MWLSASQWNPPGPKQVSLTSEVLSAALGASGEGMVTRSLASAAPAVAFHEFFAQGGSTLLGANSPMVAPPPPPPLPSPHPHPPHPPHNHTNHTTDNCLEFFLYTITPSDGVDKDALTEAVGYLLNNGSGAGLLSFVPQYTCTLKNGTNVSVPYFVPRESREQINAEIYEGAHMLSSSRARPP